MRVFVHKSTFLGASGGSKHQIFAFFLHFLVPKNPTRGRNFPEKKNFFFRFFDFLTRRWPIQNALVVQKMAGE